MATLDQALHLALQLSARIPGAAPPRADALLALPGVLRSASATETEEQQKQLLQKGCTRYQGFLFGKPMPIESFDAFLRLDGL